MKVGVKAGLLAGLLGDYSALMKRAAEEEEDCNSSVGDVLELEEEDDMCPAMLVAEDKIIELPRHGEMPRWTSRGARNARGMIATGHDQYVGLVQLHDVVIEAILDTGGARSLMDVHSAAALKLPYELASG